MITCYLENNMWIAHLDDDIKWTPDTRRKFLKEAAVVAEEIDYAPVWTTVTPDKSRLMEHIGFQFMRNILTPDGEFLRVYMLDSEVFKNVRSKSSS